MKCNECLRWNGNRLSTWGDCNYVIGELVPNVKNLRNRFDFPFRVPFDAHDAKYFVERIPRPKKCDIPEGVRIHTRKEKDIVFDDDGNERTKVVRLDCYRTHKDYYCGYEEL